MQLPRSEASVAEHNGKIYFMGGYPGARITSDSVQVYDPKTDSWELGPPLPVPLHHTMASAANGRLYIIGGEAGNPSAARASRTASPCWTSRPGPGCRGPRCRPPGAAAGPP